MTRRPRFEVYPVTTHPDHPHRCSVGDRCAYSVTEWRWRLRAANGRILASGEGFASKKNAHRAVWTVANAAEVASWQDVVEVDS